MCQIQTEQPIPWLHDGQIHSRIGRCTGVGLHVDPVAAIQFFCTFTGKRLCLINILAADVVPFAWETFGVLVGQCRSHRFKDGARDEIFRGDQFQTVILAVDFTLDDGKEVWIVSFRCVHGS